MAPILGPISNPALLPLAMILILSAFGVILVKKPVHSSLSFLFTLLTLAALYLQMSAEFIAVMQVLVYAGAILVIFMFVIVLFQDAHQKIAELKEQSFKPLVIFSCVAFVLALMFLGTRFAQLRPMYEKLPEGFGTVQALGHSLYIDFFLPFEAVVLLFLIAAVGALYIGKKRE